MNFLDTYDITGGSSTPPPNRGQQSLNEEVNQVIGQLGRFWGGFKKQSQTVLETARKDLGDVVSNAQQELNKLTPAGTTPVTDASPSEEETQASESEEDGDETTPISSSTATLKEADTITGAAAESSDSTTTPPTNQWNTHSLFSRLQSALPPTVVSTVQTNMPDTIRQASENIDFGQLRTNLYSEFQRIQGVTRTQAEEYVHKSEALLRGAVKEAGEVLRDAVKVIPPDDTDPALSPSPSPLVWDGSDMWMLPAEPSESSMTISDRSEKGKNVESGIAAVATRAEALLRRLKHDPIILQHDPGADGSTKEKFRSWIEREIESKEGGLENEEWKAKIAKSLDETNDGNALATLRDTLVPSELAEAEFWRRFFFRVHQIKEEEEKRKVLLQATESEDDFDWDDDDSESEKHAKEESPKSPRSTPPQPNLALPPSTVGTRESSLDSFDVVSSTNASVAGEVRNQGKRDAEDSEDDDSDWE